MAIIANTEVVPVSISEQLAVVAAFIIFLGGVWLFVQWVLKWAKDIISEQRNEWQKFIECENGKTRDWLDQQEDKSRDSIDKVTKALDLVIKQLEGLTDQLSKHDDKVEDKFENAVRMVTNGNGNKIPERRKQTRS